MRRLRLLPRGALVGIIALAFGCAPHPHQDRLADDQDECQTKCAPYLGKIDFDEYNQEQICTCDTQTVVR